MYAAAHDAKLAETTHVLSTEGMVNHAASSPKREFVVATETGIMHRLHKEAPDKRFALGVQWHPEVDEPLVRRWVADGAVDPELVERELGALARADDELAQAWRPLAVRFAELAAARAD